MGLDSIHYHGETDPTLDWPFWCPLVSCSFEPGNPVCGWRPTSTVGPQWTSKITGARDGDGVFEASLLFGDNARAQTDCLILGGNTELSFWYRISSTNLTSIQILMANFSNEEHQPTTLWSSREGEPWNILFLLFKCFYIDFQLDESTQIIRTLFLHQSIRNCMIFWWSIEWLKLCCLCQPSYHFQKSSSFVTGTLHDIICADFKSLH